MSWLSWHEKSEKLASEAHVLMRLGQIDRARVLFSEAAEAENQALLAVDASKTRTLGITAVSTTSLWFKANKFATAEATALKELASGRLPEFATDQLRSLLQATWTEQAMRRAGISFLPGQVLVSVKGGQTISGGAPLDLIVEKVQTVQALFFRTIEYLKDLPHRNRGAPTMEIQQACRPWLLQAPPGSYQFSVAIQEPAQKDFFKGATPNATEVADHFMTILRASSEGPAEDLVKLIPKADYRKTFLKLTRNLSPTGKNFSHVEIKSAGETNGVSLGAENRKAISRVLRPAPTEVEAINVEQTEIHGILRALHLERDWLEVLVDGETVHVEGLSESVDDIIGAMVAQS